MRSAGPGLLYEQEINKNKIRINEISHLCMVFIFSPHLPADNCVSIFYGLIYRKYKKLGLNYNGQTNIVIEWRNHNKLYISQKLIPYLFKCSFDQFGFYFFTNDFFWGP